MMQSSPFLATLDWRPQSLWDWPRQNTFDVIIPSVNPKAQGCEARATLGDRPPNLPNRNVVAAYAFPPACPTLATTLAWSAPFTALHRRQSGKAGTIRGPLVMAR